MKKFKKLLSVILAVVMALSCLTVMGSAYQDYENPGAYFYDSNDTPRSFLYTDEQRASFLTDMVDELLAGAGIYQDITVAKVDLRSLDATMSTLSNLGTIISLGGLFLDLGILEDLDRGSVNTTKISTANGAWTMLNTLLNILNDNAGLIGDILRDGKINLGFIASVANLDLSAVDKILADLPSLLGGLIYGLGARKITNGIGSDPKYPNSAVWDDMETADKPNFDTMVSNLIFKLLTEPKNTMATSDASRNEIITNPTAFGATEAMIHQEADTGLYYIYGTQRTDGTWVFTETSKDGDDSDKQYISQWDDNSALIKGVAAAELKTIINFTEGDIYTILEKAIPWAYNTFAAHNLDAQLRATLMQFCGAFNNGNTVDEATKAELKDRVAAYKAIEDAANGDKAALRNAFAAEQGAAGNVNFMYIDLEGNRIGDKTSDSLYYVVEWGGSYEYYHVELDDTNALFDLIDWEWQMPMWETVAAAAGIEAGKSFLLHINDIVGTLLKTAMPSLQWTAGTADNTLANNLTALAKLVIHNAKAEIWGENYVLPAGFDSFNLEQLLVLIAGELLDGLMPQLVLPADVTSVEEVGAYALREFMAEIMPDLGAGWDAKFEAAKALSGTAREDAFLDVVLNMGVSTGAYYLKNVIGLGTVTDGKNNTSVEAVPMGADYEWREILNYIIDWAIKTWVPGITGNVDKKFPGVMSGSDPLLKLSAVLSTILPTLVRTIGADVDGYALNLNHVYDDLRLAFNGNFAELAKGLLRKDSGTAGNMEIMQFLATLIKELFGGLGFDATGSTWTTLSGILDNAATSATPLTTLIGSYGGNAALATLVEPFIVALTDTRDIWLKPVLTILLNFLGGLTSTLTNSGIVVEGVESAYTGATSFEINYSFEMTTSGVKTYFNNGRYKTTAGAIAGLQSGFDGDYKLKFIDAKVVDANGNVKNTVDYGNYIANANEKIPGTVPFSGVTEKIEVYTLETRYQVIAPDGSEGEVMTDSRSFTVTSLANDALSKTSVAGPKDYTSNGAWVSTLSGCGDSAVKQQFFGNWTLHYRNIYISEAESLSKAETPIFSMTDTSLETTSNGDMQFTPLHSYTKVWVDGYGTNTYNDDGSITIADATATKITVSGAASSINDTWFKWAGNENALNTNTFLTVEPLRGVAQNTTSAEHPLWVAATNVKRADFTEDYYTYAINIPLSLHTNMGGADGVLDGESMDAKDLFNFTTYITLYNSYGLQAKLDAALAYDEEHYDVVEGATAWAELQAAIDYANTQMYGAWNATQFQNNHTANITALPTGIPKDLDGNNYEGYTQATVSTFKYASDRLDAAMTAMAEYVLEVEEEEVSLVAPSDPSSDLYPVYQALKAVDDKEYRSHNYVGYRWFKFSDEREAIRTALNAATPPAPAYNTLAGVPLDNAGINAVVDTLTDADIKAIVASLVEAPTQEALDAAAEALENFAPVYDVDALMMQVQNMQTNERRLISKYDSQQKYYLNKSIADFGNVAAAGYTTETYTAYTEALAAANAANASSTASQYEIFSARYELQYAYNKLVPTDEAVDMEALKAAMDEAKVILNALGTADEYASTNPEVTTEEAYKALVLALGIKTEYEEVTYFIGGNFNAEYALAQEGTILASEQQAWVNSITANLEAAVANFKATALPELITSEYGASMGVVLDKVSYNANGNGFIYGIDTDFGEMIENYFETPAGSVVVTPNANGVYSTGSTIELLDASGVVVETYHFIFFGDVNGDGWVDATDVTAVEGINSFMDFDYFGGDGTCESMAMDTNGDGWIDATDVTYVEGVNSFMDFPMQSETAATVAANKGI